MTIHAQPFGAPDLAGKTVLLRVDIEALKGSDAKSLAAALARTVDDLTRRHARVIVLSHRGAPSSNFDPDLSLRPLAIELSKALDKVVTFIPGRVDEGAQHAIAMVAEGGVGLLENLRFTKGEDANDRDFAKALASLGDLHINAVGRKSRPRASTHAIAEFMPSYAISHAA